MSKSCKIPNKAVIGAETPVLIETKPLPVRSESTGSILRCCNPNCRKLTTKLEAGSRNFNVGRCGHCGSKLFETKIFEAKLNT